MPTIRLFPAGQVSVAFFVHQNRLSVLPRWLIDEQDNPPWVASLLAYEDQSETSLEYHGWLEPNRVSTFYVPAGVKLHVKLDTPYDRKFCPIDIDQTIYLELGETLDLGSYTSEPALAVTVRVVDSAG